jgi:hypothetical protein
LLVEEVGLGMFHNKSNNRKERKDSYQEEPLSFLAGCQKKGLELGDL